MKLKVVSSLSHTLKVAVRELAELDESIAREQASGEKAKIAVAFLLEGRNYYQLGLDELLKAQQKLELLDRGGPLPETHPSEGHRPVTPGQYMGLKLSTAVQAYLSDRGRGPIKLSQVVHDLIAGGFKIFRTKSKYHQGETRDPNARDLRLLANNNRKRFQYDPTGEETIALRPIPGNDTGRRSVPTAKHNGSEAVTH